MLHFFRAGSSRIAAEGVDRFPVQISGTDLSPAGKGINRDAGMTANAAWNAARLQIGMTEILVAPGLNTPQDEAKPEHPHQNKDEGAAGDLSNGPHSQTLKLHLEADSEVAADEIDPHVLSEAEEDEATPGTGLPGRASRPWEEEQVMAADADQDDADAESMVSDGADSYQGLPPETLARLAASTNETASNASEEAEQDAAAAEYSEALDAACKQDSKDEEQQLLQDARKPGATAETEADAKAEQNNDMTPGEQLQHGNSIGEPQNQSKLQMAVDEVPDDAPVSPHSTAAAQALSSSGEVKWQTGTEVEVRCSKAPLVWSWQSGTLVGSCSSAATQAMVQWAPPHSAGSPHGPMPCLPELVVTARLRPVPPIEMHVAETDMPPRGSLLEVDCGNDGSYKCAVLVGRQRIYLGEQQDLDSMIHAVSPGMTGAAA